ncbi:SDR family NAD(P)-dependent oxidoreductase [Micromonospora sp. WMMD1120]|uniref:SDR family NAD(P)-dependent oxidoreductase n=1 Tax=Micromonospora sp. WMMD1120 TaxID=3016106 RepID=UPI002416B0F9|nr:SDR family NAD(P)-dependent oxidoreductase [Micromonospora sp. WMMD1120]MDG4810842.1 SDR family NAD(P)-dependent oxidoreductase [Micromonospora sp. WMMD1120]
MNAEPQTVDEVLHRVRAGELTPEQALPLLRRLAAGTDDLVRLRQVWEPAPVVATPGRRLKHVVLLGGGAPRVAAGAWPVDRLSVVEATTDEDEADRHWTDLCAHGVPDAVVHVGALDTSGDHPPRPEQVDSDVTPLLCLLRAAARTPSDRPVPVVVAHPGSVVGAAVGGLARSAARECGWLRPRVVDVGALRGDALAAALWPELVAADPAVEVRFGVAGREALGYRRAPVGNAGPAVVSTGDVYVVSGGLGGLGRPVVEALVGSGARVAVLGRSEPDAAARRWLAEQGGSVLFVRTDVSVRADVIAAVGSVRERFGRVDGVVHSAGVNADGWLRDKSVAAFRSVLAAKVWGAVWLDEATAADDLKVFVGFSSVAGLVGNAGQCDYAYGNRFLDEFARWRTGRRPGRSVSVAWPYWADGGMRIDEATQRLMRGVAGIRPIHAAEGVAMFWRALAADEALFVELHGDEDRILRTFAATAGVRAPASADPTGTDTDADASGRLLERVRADLLAAIHTVLDVDPADVDLDAHLSEFGFDSISFTELANVLNEQLGLDLLPSVFFEYPTLAAFADHLLREHADQLRDHYGAAPPPAPVSAPAPPSAPAPVVAADREPAPPVATPGDAVAIVGLAGVFPGGNEAEGFFADLAAGRDLVGEVPANRWDWRRWYGDPWTGGDRTPVRWGAFLSDVDRFDPRFFGISAVEADLMDPQQRVFLETVWRVIEDAGYRASDLAGTDTGLFVGVGGMDYLELMLAGGRGLQPHTPTGIAHSVLANRVSFLLDLHGPSEPVDTACSASLVAVHRAVASIQRGECGAAIAGGVNVMATPTAHIAFTQAGMLASDGRCKVFDAAADGYVRGEGCGAVLLKPLHRAVADGDHVYAVVRGSAVNHGGRAASLTAPNTAAQARLVVRAWERSGLDPASCSFVETHGTGTALGDPIETTALTRAFATLYERWGHAPATSPHCALGSVKSNVGHLETAAGMAGLTKVLLGMRHRRLPGNLHVNSLNPYIRLDGTPFAVLDHTRDWDSGGVPRRAGISGFGYGGVNAHLVLEEHVAPVEATTPSGPQVITLSARTPDRLTAVAQRLAAHLDNARPALEDVAYTLRVGREPMAERLAVVARDVDEARAALDAFVDGEPAVPGVFRSRAVPPSANGHAADHGVGRGVDARVNGHVVVTVPPEPGLATANGHSPDDHAAAVAIAWAHGDDPAGTPPGRRISLPTYPFAGDRYWGADLPVPRATGPTDREPPAPTLLRQVWEPATARPAPTEPAHATVVLADDGRLAEDYLAADPSAVVVTPGAAYRRAGRRVTADPRDPAHLDRLLSELGGRLDVIHLSRARPAPERVVDEVLLPLVGLLRALLGRDALERLRLLYVHAGPAAPADTAVAAVLRGLAQEDSRFTGRRLDVAGVDGRLAARCRDEFAAPDTVEVRYADGVRHRRRLVPATAGSAPALPVRAAAAYLVTGGAGGLGRIIADHLLSQAARVVLLGRSAVGAELRGWLDARPDAAYLRADVTDEADLRGAVATARERFGPLRGVVHAAGVNRDRLLGDTDDAGIRAVTAAKVYGTAVLDRVTTDQPLDFFAVFSSLAGVLGNAGQTDYAYANAYQAAYVADRQGPGRGVTLHWPLWESGGMSAPGEAARRARERFGSHPLPTAEGLRLWDEVLAGGHPEAVVLYGTRPLRWHAELMYDSPGAAVAVQRLDATAVPSNGSAAPGEPVPAGEPAAPVGRMLAVVREVLAGLLRVDPADLAVDADLNDLGIDSLLVRRFSDELTRRLGTVPTTLLYEHRTPAALAAHLETTHGARTAGPATTAPVAVPPPVAEPIAVIGLGGRYPQAADLDEFWRNLAEGRDCVTEVPADRWDVDRYYDPDPLRAVDGKTYCRSGAFLDGVDRFDPLFFGISPREAETIDPQERLFLQTAWATFEDAGYPRQRLRERGGRVGVFAGATTYTYLLWGPERWASGVAVHPQTAPWSIANRVSYVLGLHGPSMPVDTACSSSLTAVHLACASIRRGECEMALAGGVNLYLHPSRFSTLSQARMLSPTQRCRSFGAGADGFVPGEGVGAVLLKPLSAALRDGDRIHAVIRGSAVNHAGATRGFTVPDPNAQADVIHAALREADVDPATVTFVEAHGTGTELGDPLEVAGLTNAFRRTTDARGYCALGSAKSLIGHLEAAAGIAGLTKVILQMRHRRLAPTLHCDPPNPGFDLAGTPFALQRSLAPWTTPPDVPRRAGVSSFGAGGANAHVVVEEWAPAPTAPAPTPGPEVVVLSARTEERLRAYAGRLADHLRDAAPPVPVDEVRAVAAAVLGLAVDELPDDEPLDELGADPVTVAEITGRLRGRYGWTGAVRPTDTVGAVTGRLSGGGAPAIRLADVAYTLRTGREAMAERLAVVADDPAALVEALAGFAAGDDSGVIRGGGDPAAPGDEPGRLARAWVAGQDVDWPTGTGALISLPTYPFAEARCWFEETDADTDIDAGADTGTRTELTGREFVLTDHVVAGRPTLPAVALLEIARRAAEATGDGPVRRLRDVVLARPVQIDGAPVSVRSTVRAVDGGLRVEWEADGRPCGRLHAETGPAPDPGRVDLDEVRARCADRRDSAPYYAAFDAAGLRYGPSFRSLRELRCGPGEVLARLELPEPRRADTGYELHPSFLDGALQAVAGAWDAPPGDAAPVYVPFAVAEVVVAGPTPRAGYAHVVARAETRTERRYDVRVTDEHGDVRVELRGLALRAVPVGDGPLFFAGDWVAASAPEPAAGPVLLLDHDRRRVAPGTVLVRPGDRYREVVAGAEYEVDPRSVDDHRRVREALSARGDEPVAVLHLWSLTAGADDDPLGSLLPLTRAWARSRTPIPLVYAHPTAAPEAAAVAGFARTVRQEQPHLAFTTVRLDDDAATDPLLPRRLGGEGAEVEVRYLGVQRAVWRWRETAAPVGDAAPAGTVCLVTGGQGGLGRLVVEHLVAGGARVVAVGRSTPDRDWLAGLGPSVTFVRGDVSVRADAFAVVAAARERFGRVDVVVHAAGVLRDGLVAGKSPADLAAVCGPKVAGARWLDEATADLGVERFVLFSSLAGALGNVGQADYAYANRFLDEFAAWRSTRRPGVTVSVGWPLWDGGGMTVDAALRQRLWETAGTRPLPPAAGLAVLDAVLTGASVDPQVRFLYGDTARLRVGLGLAAAPESAPTARAAEPVRVAAAPTADGGALRVDVTRVCADVLKVDVAELDPDEDLSAYGLDSILLMTLLNRLETRFDTVVEPSAVSEHPTIAALAAYLARTVPSASPTGPSTAGPSVDASPVAAVSPTAGPEHAVAVVGMAGRFPGSASVPALWDNLVAGRCLVSEVPADRWDVATVFDPTRERPNSSYSKWGGFTDGAFDFDAGYFRVAEADALVMDPHHRLVLELAAELFADAGYRPDEVAGSRTGVFIGGGESPYLRGRIADLPQQSRRNALVGAIPNMMAARVSDFFDLRGPAQTIDTACSSALVAIHAACRALRSGECDIAIAGGVELIIGSDLHVGFSEAGALAPDGVCAVFDESASGLVLGEGGGLVLLRRLPDAVADGDRIAAVVRGGAVNNDGRTMGLTVPSVDGQEAVLRAALADADVPAGSVGYLEAHGTGTLLGDPIEVRAATRVFDGRCGIGSVKSNVGHLMRAAGVVGFVKAVLAVQTGVLPATLHCVRPHPRFRFAESPFFPVTSTQPWSAADGSPRRAGVSAFGFGGTNAHVVVEQYQGPAGNRSALPPPRFDRRRYRLDEPVTTAPDTLDDLLDLIEDGHVDLDHAAATVVRLSKERA